MFKNYNYTICALDDMFNKEVVIDKVNLLPNQDSTDENTKDQHDGAESDDRRRLK